MREVSVGIILKDGEVLACQRRRTARYPLKWEFPGGKIEEGETPQQALLRELREELAIEAVIGKELHRQEWTYPEGVSDRSPDNAFRVFYHLVPYFAGTPVNHAFEQILWVSPPELLAMDILEGNREAVRLLVEHEATPPPPA